MKILLLTTTLTMGGAEKLVTRLADAFAAKGHDVCIAYFILDAVVLPLNPKVKIINLKMKGKFDVLPTFLRIRKLLSEFCPDVVHSHLPHANLIARLVRLAVPMRRLICTAHNTHEGGRALMLAYRLTDRLASISTNVSQEAVEAFEKAHAVKSGRMVVVHNGIPTDEFNFSFAGRKRVRDEILAEKNRILLLAVGRLTEAKDYPNLFQALLKIDQKKFDFQLCIAGDGALRNDLGQMVLQMGLHDRVKFLGVRRDIVDLMSAADVFVLSSAWEGLPLVVAEAMACSRVVVATDCGGVREVVGDAGFLVPPHDADQLAGALTRALELSADQASRLGALARQRVVDMYSLDAAIDKWLKLYVAK